LREERVSEPTATTQDLKLEGMLRPQTFGEFVGQQAVIENLKVYVQAARNRGDVLDHILISGPPGLGKTTLAGIIANELGTELRHTTGPALEKPADLAGIQPTSRRAPSFSSTRFTASARRSRSISTLRWRISGSIL
jgi:holliday junction DNA helicase RuvB